VLYATVHVFLGRWYWVPRYHYLTPFYSPCVSGACAAGSSSLGTWFPKVPSIIPYAVVSLPFVLGFRLTCYYYRRAYYRAFWRAPAACAVREPHATYSGETRFPLILQNLHRYFFWAAVAISVLNTYDVIQAFHGKDGESASASARWSCSPTWCCSGRTRCPATRAGTSPGAGSSTSPHIQSGTGSGLRSPG
jgi:hypothetical protein